MLSLSTEQRKELRGLLKQAAELVRQLAGEEKTAEQARESAGQEPRTVVNVSKLRRLGHGNG